MEEQVTPPERLGAKDAAAAPPATAAIRHPATRAAFRQRQSGPHMMVGGSLVLLTVFVIVVGWAGAHSERLAATGLDTSGEVVEVRGPPGFRLFDSGSVVVAYQVEQEPAPRRAVGIVTLVLGGMGLPAGVGWWLGGRRLRRELVRNRWQVRRYRHATVPVDGTEDATQTVRVLAVDARMVGASAPLLLEASAIGEAATTPGSRRGRCGSLATRRRGAGWSWACPTPMPCRCTARGGCAVTSGRGPWPPWRAVITSLEQVNRLDTTPGEHLCHWR
jgi:hypothetical protein